jgi:hypothetical protein
MRKEFSAEPQKYGKADQPEQRADYSGDENKGDVELPAVHDETIAQAEE